MKTKIFTLCFALVASVGTMFASTQIGDLYYNLDAVNHAAEVTSSNGSSYSGSVIIPESVTYETKTYSITSIGKHAFYGCSGLTSVTIPNSVTSIGYDAFYGCTSLPVTNNLRYADTYLVEAVDKTLSSYIIKDGTKWIGTYAFIGCGSLTTVTIPNSVTSIGEYAFSGRRSLTSVTIPNSVISIGECAFLECTSLTSVTIGNGVTSIEKHAFGKCTSLTSVTIGNSVTNIDEWAFYDCSSLTSVTCEAVTPPTMGPNVFREVDCSNIPLYVPAQSVDVYKTAFQWKEFNPILAIAQGIDKVNDNQKQSTKLLRNGQLFILCDDEIYNILGGQMR